MTPAYFAPVPLDKSYRLLNHGPTVLVSARHGGGTDVMAAAWACVLDYGQPPRVTVVLDKATRTRELIEASGAFALQLPTRAQIALTVGVGTDSLHTVPDKLARHGVELFEAPGADLPLVPGAAVAQNEQQSDILQALIALGYSEREATAAVKKLPADVGVSDGIKLALKALA